MEKDGKRMKKDTTQNFPRLELGGGNSNIFGIFTPKIGEDEPNFDEHIFQMGGSTTNQRSFYLFIPFFSTKIGRWI